MKFVLPLGFLLLGTACVTTTSSIKNLPRYDGNSKNVSAKMKDVKPIVRMAFPNCGLAIEDQTVSDAGFEIIGYGGFGATSWGTVVRVLGETTTDANTTLIRVSERAASSANAFLSKTDFYRCIFNFLEDQFDQT